MRCETCAYWDREDEYLKRDYSLGLGLCCYARMYWDCTEWGDEEDDYRRKFIPEYAHIKMFVQDGSDYRAYLLTKPDFGCVAYVKKPSPEQAG